MNVLEKILARKREELAAARAALRPFARALVQPGRVTAIAEIKRASPSAGPIRPGADPAAIAREYAANGAAAISVLTDRDFFDGDLAFLRAVRAAVDLPLLRKDFVIDTYQVAEARAAGADAVLLIAAALDDGQLRTLTHAARALGLDPLVEVHSEAEVDRAIAASARLIGINHRDLATFTIDMGLTARLVARLPPETVIVAESGIKTREDVRALGAAGAHAILVGETLMRAPSPGAALAELLA